MHNKTRTPLFHVAKRAALPWYKSWAIRGAALLLALILCGVITSLVTGEDLDVLLELADRILVLCGGKVSGIVPGRGAKKRDVGMMMTKLGGKADE